MSRVSDNAASATDLFNAANLEHLAAELLITVDNCCGPAPLCAACREAHRRAAGYQARAEYLRTPQLGLVQLVRRGDA